MNIALTSVVFLGAILCVGVMDFAIQRGATCTVAAVDEAVNQRRFQRLLSMMEASLWMVGGLAIARSGSDEWSYVAAPFDFFLGCAILPYLYVASPSQPLGYCSPVLLIPGGSDGLVLVGMPLLWPYAWLALLAMVGAIVAAQWMESSLSAESMREVRSPGYGPQVKNRAARMPVKSEVCKQLATGTDNMLELLFSGPDQAITLRERRS